MLGALRDKKIAKKVWIILAILIVPAFVLWGSGSLVRGKKEPAYLGTIFGKRISYLEFSDALDAVKNQAIIQFGDDFSEIQKYMNFETQAWERLILLAEAKKRKVKVKDKEIIELIQSYPFFQRKGRFDSNTYASVLDYVFHAQPRLFEEQTRQNLMLSKLYQEITDNLTLTDEEIKEEYRKSNEQISVYYIAGLPSDFTKDVAAPEQDIKDYFAKNSLQFKQPLSFNLEYMSLPAQDKGTKDKLDKLALSLNKREDFAKIAGELGLTVKETGLFTSTDPIPGIGWSQEILNSISGAKLGEPLPPVYMDKQYYIFRLKDIKDAHVPDFEAIKEKVKEKFMTDNSRRLAKEKTEACLKKTKEMNAADFKLTDFDRIANECGLKSGSTDLFKYNSYIEGIGASDIFWLIGHRLKEGETSQIIETPSGFYIIGAKSRAPVDEAKFQAEKEEFTQQLLVQKKAEFFAKFIEELKRRAQAF